MTNFSMISEIFC